VIVVFVIMTGVRSWASHRPVRAAADPDGQTPYVMTGSLPLGNWPYQVTYQWGVLVKALIRYRSCW